MWHYLIISIISFVASGLTLFSGFGLGTLLMPVMAIFFPLDLAIGMTAIVHLFNNLFKLVLLGRKADWSTVCKFGLPAMIAAYLGAWCLEFFAHGNVLYQYILWGRTMEITGFKLVMASLILLFAIAEIAPAWKDLAFDKKYLPVGGLLSGFFGGFSGHQGLLRSAFLIRCNLSKESYIGTGVVIACAVDIVRLFVYTSRFQVTQNQTPMLVVSTLSAFLGVWIGNHYLKKITIHQIQIVVTVLFFTIAVGLIAGFI